MTNSAQPLPPGSGDGLAKRPLADLPSKDVMVSPDTPLRYVEAPAHPVVGKDAMGGGAGGAKNGVLRGLRDLQQLQKQTIAVLESLKSSLDDISQVLRSPEATRGHEKEKNAATLLAKGFAHEAIEQARDAAQLLPANPEAQLLLALSLASDQQFDPALAATRKGLALLDRRHHPLAIEAGLLHTLATLGHIHEALERWTAIIDSLPLPVLLEQMTCIAACFPNMQGEGELPEGTNTSLDHLLATRITRGRLASPRAATASPTLESLALALSDPTAKAAPTGPRMQRSLLIDTRPSQIPAASLLAGIDAAGQFSLTTTHRAILVLMAQRLNVMNDAGEVVKFITECVVPLGNRSLKNAHSLARASVKKLLRTHADAETLHRAMMKFQLADTTRATRQLAGLLDHWGVVARQAHRSRIMLTTSVMLVVVGTFVLGWILFGMGAIHGRQLALPLGPWRVDAIFAGPIMIGVGVVMGLVRLLAKPMTVNLPHGRPPLSAGELRFLQTPGFRHSLRGVAGVRRRPQPL